MKKVIGKNQVIITSLAILIAVAGYLNFADVDLGFRDKEASTDSSSILEDAGYDLTDETALLESYRQSGNGYSRGGCVYGFYRICRTGKDQQRTGALTEQGRSAGHYQ